MKLEKIIEKLKDQGISPKEQLYKGGVDSADEMKRWGLAWLEAAAETEREERERAEAAIDIKISALDYLDALLSGLEIDKNDADSYIAGTTQLVGEWSQAVFSAEFTRAIREFQNWIEERQESLDPEPEDDYPEPDYSLGGW